MSGLRELDEFINRVEWLRDPTHVRSYTVAEWRAKVQAVGLEVLHTEAFRKTHDFADWTRRSGMSVAGVAELAAAFRQAPEAVQGHFGVTVAGGAVVSFTDDKMLLVARRP